MPRESPFDVNLLQEERQALESVARKYTSPYCDVIRAKIILLASDGKTVVERELKPGRLVIGRTPDNDLQIDSKFISRHHCQIVTQPDACLIEDLNSTNGIYVQSKRVRRYNLNDGDVVQVGQHEIMYIDERVPRPRHPVETADNEATEKS